MHALPEFAISPRPEHNVLGTGAPKPPSLTLRMLSGQVKQVTAASCPYKDKPATKGLRS